MTHKRARSQRRRLTITVEYENGTQGYVFSTLPQLQVMAIDLMQRRYEDQNTATLDAIMGVRCEIKDELVTR